MAIIKYANFQFSLDEIHDAKIINANYDLQNRLLHPESADIDEDIKKRFIKFAANLKRISPKSNDFLYFSCVMLHSAERAIIDGDGNIKKDKNGNLITAEWKIDKKGSWKWICSDPDIRPYKNNNSDIFPESELKQAYRKWIGRPLCKDHQSSSVDGIRGIIVDTYYDDKFKRVIGLCALDKVNYPDLARKIETGYSRDVSMGTAVGKSICYECGNVAKIEADYCQHCRSKTTYGEINIDLSPIELSLVVTGADPEAKLRSIIASLNQYSDEKGERIEELKKAGCVTPGELERLEKEVNDLRKIVSSLIDNKIVKTAIDPDKVEQARNLGELLKTITNPQIKQKIESMIEDLLGGITETNSVEPPYGVAGNHAMTGGREQSYTQDLQSNGPTDINNPTGFDTRLASDNALQSINLKLDAMDNALRDISKGVQGSNNKEEQKMSDKLRERAAARRAMFQKTAYLQGGGGLNDPQVYPKDPMGDKVRDTEDKQMVGLYLDENPEDLGGGKEELSLKQKLSRAELEERKIKRHALLKGATDDTITGKDGKKYAPVIGTDGKTTYKEVTAAEDGEMDMGDVFGKQAYFQGGGGVNEPQTYSKDPMAEKVRNTEDKQMVGMYLDENPEDLGGGREELSLKQKMLRADEKLRAKFVMAFKADGAEIDKESSRWDIYAGDRKVLSATGAEIYEDELEANWKVLASKEWGHKVLATIREQGLDKVAWMLKGDGFTKTAQPPMPPAPPMPPMDMMGGAPGAPEEPKEEDKGEGKDPVDDALETLTKTLEESEKSLGDLKDALQKSTGKPEEKLPFPAEADDDEGEDACKECKKCPCVCEEEDEKEDEDEKDADDSVSDQIQEVYAALDESADELAMLAESLDSRKRAGKTVKDVVTAELLKLTKEALFSNASISKEASLIVDAAKKKEKKEEEDEPKKGKKGKKVVEEEDEPKKGKKSKKVEEDEEDEPKKGKKGKKVVEEDEEEDKPKKGKKSKAEEIFDRILVARSEARRNIVRSAEEMFEDEGSDEVASLKAENAKLKSELDALKSEEKEEIMNGEEPAGAHEDLGLEVEEMAEDMYSDDDLDGELAKILGDIEGGSEGDEVEGDEEGKEVTASDRRAWREKVAAEMGAKYQLRLDSEVTSETNMPLSVSHKMERLDTKTDESVVEGIVDMHNDIMKQVESLPTVREAMEHLGNMLKSGQLKLAELGNVSKLTALGCDPACAKYWKDYFGEAEGDKESKAFGEDMVKDYTTKKAELNVEDQKIRLKRAYDLALDMQERGIIEEGKAVLHKQAADLSKLDDDSFESLKKVVARANNKLNKTAAHSTPALNIGLVNTDTMVAPVNFSDQLSKLFDK